MITTASGPKAASAEQDARAVDAVLVNRSGEVLLRGRAVVEAERAAGLLWPEPGVEPGSGLLGAVFLIVSGPWRWEVTDVEWVSEGVESAAHVAFRLPAVPVD